MQLFKALRHSALMTLIVLYGSFHFKRTVSVPAQHSIDSFP